MKVDHVQKTNGFPHIMYMATDSIWDPFGCAWKLWSYPAVMVMFCYRWWESIGFLVSDPSHRIPWILPGSLSLANMVECPVGTQESVGNGQDVALFRFHTAPCEFSRMIFDDFGFVYTKYVFPGSASQAFAQHFNTAFRYLQPAVQRALEVGMCDRWAFQK